MLQWLPWPATSGGLPESTQAHPFERCGMKRLLLLSLLDLCLALLVLGCAAAGTSTPRDSARDSPTASATAKALPAAETPPPSATPSPQRKPSQPREEVVAEQLDVPWSLAFAPDGRLFFT